MSVRRWIVVAGVMLGFAVGASSAQATVTGDLTGTTATFTGDGGIDFLTISKSGGELRHSSTDPGFASSADFDSVDGGVQTLPDTAAAHVIVNAGDNVDLLQLGFAGDTFQAAFTMNGEGGADFLSIPPGTSAADSVALNGSAITTAQSGPISYSTLEQVNVRLAGDNDVVQVNAATGTQTNVYGEDGDDTLRLADGTNMTSSGSFRGGPGTDTLDYSAWTTPVTVDIGKTAMFSASLDEGQEVPPTGSAATGDGLVEFTDLATNTFRYELAVDGLTSVQITDSHIHAGAPGAIGGVVFPIGAGAGWSDPAGPSTEATNQTDADITEPLLRAGNTYFNVHTAANINGEIRGQLTLDPEDGYGGPATGVSRAHTVENVIGGSGPDNLRGSVVANVLEGRGGADILDGGEGADTLDCGEGADVAPTDPTATLVSCETGPGPGEKPVGSISELKPKASGKGAKITIDTGATATCPLNATADCALDATAKAKVKSKGGKAKNLSLGRLDTSLARGADTAVKIKTSSKASKLWRKAGKLKIKLAVELTVPGGDAVTRSGTAKLKAPKQK
jgi:hypothetical protein